jgi:glycosyltransferase involved in cell wall biosynthesis
LQHRLQPEFPEVFDNGEFRRRDFMFSSIVAKASAILCDSKIGKDDILSVYGGVPNKIHSLPYFAPRHIYAPPAQNERTQLSRKYHLPENFFFYPATFWRHKNHALIVRALAEIKRTDEECPHVVFAGSKTREYESVFHLVRELGVKDRVHFIGYVPDSDMAGLYRLAEALVMPTFFGPTNIPVIEAWACGCPVITSDIRGLVEQVSDAGLLVNPRDPKALADAMMRIHGDRGFRQRLSEKGIRKEASWRAADYGRTLWNILRGLIA